jgi:hypothetical protein
VRLPSPPPGGPCAERGVAFALHRRRATCLEAALVRQAVLGGRGVSRELVIGVAGSAGSFRAHAWLHGDPIERQFTELTRRPSG